MPTPTTPANETRHFVRLLARYGQRLKMPNGSYIDGAYIPGTVDRYEGQWGAQDVEKSTLMLRATDVPAGITAGDLIEVVDTTTNYEILEAPRYNITRSVAHLIVTVRTTSTLATA